MFGNKAIQKTKDLKIHFNQALIKLRTLSNLDKQKLRRNKQEAQLGEIKIKSKQMILKGFILYYLILMKRIQ